MDYAEIIVTAIVSAGIPSAVCGLLLKRYVGRLDRRDAARAEEARLAYQADQAALGGVRECAKAIVKLDPGRKASNGDLDRAAAYAEEIKHKQADFMARKAAAK